MILGNNVEKIIKMASECQSYMVDGVVQYDYENQNLYSCCFTTGEMENPLNPVVEVYRLPQGDRGEIDCGCHDCPFRQENGSFDDDMIDECGENHIDCCINGLCESSEIEEEIKEELDFEVREVLSDHLSSTIEILNDIRIAISDILAPYDYFEVRQDDWEMSVLDVYIDNAIEYGFDITVSPNDWLDAEIQQLASVRYLDDAKMQKIGIAIEDYDFEKALELLGDY